MARKILVAAISVASALLLVEGGARFWLLKLAGEEDFLKYATFDQIQGRKLAPQFIPHRYLGFIPTPNHRKGKNSHNSFGFRGPEISVNKPDNIFRIACLGGSTTYGNHVGAPGESYPGRLQEFLRARGYEVEVINAGVPGYSSLDSLINLQIRVLPFSPDLILVYHGINDVHSRLVWPPSAYRRDASGYVAPIAIPNMPSLLEYSTFARIEMIDLGKILPHWSLERTLGPQPRTSFAMEFWRQMKSGSYPDGFFKDVSVREMLLANEPSHFEANLRGIVSASRNAGAQVGLITWAFSPKALTGDDPRLESPEYQKAIAEQNNIARRIASSTSTPLLDLEQMEIPIDYYHDGYHFNLEGNRFRGALVGEFTLRHWLELHQ